jgi:CheY-like chemotaxis protein
MVKRNHIVIVEDEETILDVLSLIMKKAGWTVTTARSGREAVERVVSSRERSHPADLLLLDISMPGLSGIEAIDELHKLGIRLPLIAMTGLSNAATEDQLRRRGCTQLLEKPFEANELLKIVEVTLGGEMAGPQPGKSLSTDPEKNPNSLHYDNQ